MPKGIGYGKAAVKKFGKKKVNAMRSAKGMGPTKRERARSSSRAKMVSRKKAGRGR